MIFALTVESPLPEKRKPWAHPGGHAKAKQETKLQKRTPVIMICYPTAILSEILH